MSQINLVPLFDYDGIEYIYFFALYHPTSFYLNLLPPCKL